MTWDRVERLIGKENLRLLAGKRVGVVGLGSGGGFVAVSLAMSGVGNFVLIDDDVLEEPNIVRHVADKREVGRPKAEAVADLILQRNPNAYVEARVGRIEAHFDVLDSLDVLIVGVDGEQAKYIINQACLERDLVAIYAGVYERGEGGDVVMIHPYDGPCYACWAAELREGLTITNTAGELDYGMIGPEGTLEAEPALWLHVVRVAAAQADFAMKFLLRETNLYEPLPGNTLILANAPLEIIEGEITPPHSALWFTVARDSDCLVCGDQVRASEAVQGEELSLDQLMSDNALTVEDESSPSVRQDT
jgi:molybdopterin/thiamine biosynthesis adenylyltransferase